MKAFAVCMALAAVAMTTGCAGRSAVPSAATSAIYPQASALSDLSQPDTLGGLRVSGNHLVNKNGTVIHLHGVNRSGTEYACIQGWGIFDGPNDATSVQAMKSWNVNIVRVPLNEDCWLNINGVNSQYAGTNYRSAIVSYVKLLHSYGMYAELSLMWGAPGAYQATYQPAAPDAAHSPAMWSSMATTFKYDHNVILAPWGETTVGWTCFMRTSCDNQATYGPNNAFYHTATMQQAVTRMRNAGYTGVISIPCINYANACANYNGSSWLQSHPADPDNQLIAEVHVYGKNSCDTTACFNSTMAPITNSYPLIFGETGETYDASDCGSSYISTFLPWADAHGVGYETWTWDTWGGCGVLISNYDGTAANTWASWVKTHYLSL